MLKIKQQLIPTTPIVAIIGIILAALHSGTLYYLSGLISVLIGWAYANPNLNMITVTVVTAISMVVGGLTMLTLFNDN